MDKQILTQEQEVEQLRQSTQSVLDFYDELVAINYSRRDQIAISLFRDVATLTFLITHNPQPYSNTLVIPVCC